jgi:hypothetical protein
VKFSFLPLCLILTLLQFASCRREEDHQAQAGYQKLQKQVGELSEQNRKLRQEVEQIHGQLQTLQTAPLATPVATEKLSEPKQEMSVGQMKIELASILKKAIQQVKSQLETPKRGTQFGMRMQYDLDGAVYGLVTTEDPDAPYRAKVIVKYEKFLESERKSASYGSGSTLFQFIYRKGRWILENHQMF